MLCTYNFKMFIYTDIFFLFIWSRNYNISLLWSVSGCWKNFRRISCSCRKVSIPPKVFRVSLCESLWASEVKASMERKLFIFIVYPLSQCLYIMFSSISIATTQKVEIWDSWHSDWCHRSYWESRIKISYIVTVGSKGLHQNL